MRQRQNKPRAAATLPAEKPWKRAPNLPVVRHEWQAETALWWRDVWASPMATEYLRTDRSGLLLLAELIDRFWRVPTASLAAEIRLQSAAYGLSPLDRRRLQWEVARAEETTTRRRPTPPPATDPRRALHAV